MKKTENKQPNIIIFMMDHARYDSYGIKNPQVYTPNIDTLAKSGVQFSQATATSPLCVPSRYSLFTGLYPFLNRRRDGMGDYKPVHMVGTPLLTEYFEKLGYENALVGKLHLRAEKFDDYPWMGTHYNATVEGDHFRPKGALRWREHADQSAVAQWEKEYKYFNSEEVSEEHRDISFADKGNQSLKGYIGITSRLKANDHPEWWLTDRAIDFLDNRNKSKPFLLFLSFNRPHPPLNIPAEYKKLYDLQKINLPPPAPWKGKPPYWTHNTIGRYTQWKDFDDNTKKEALRSFYASISFCDDMFGRVLTHINKQGIFNDTAFLVLSDHGDLLGERGGIFSKMLLYESSIRIPLILSYPGSTLGKNLTDDRLVEITDVLPTLLTLAGGKLSQRLNGRSLITLEEGNIKLADKKNWRTGAFAEFSYYYDHGVSAYIEKPVWMWRTERYKLIVRNPGGRQAISDHSPNGLLMELYDLKDDPDEFYNLAERPDMKKICERMVTELFIHIMDGVSG